MVFAYPVSIGSNIGSNVLFAGIMITKNAQEHLLSVVDRVLISTGRPFCDFAGTPADCPRRDRNGFGEAGDVFHGFPK